MSTPVTAVEIESLYHRKRLLDSSLVWAIGTLLYAPLGLALAVIRLFAFLQLALFLRLVPKHFFLRRWWFRGLQPGLGMVVTAEGFDKRHSDSPKILVANHVTLIDHCIVESLVPCLAVIEPSRCPVMQRTMQHGSIAVTEGSQQLITKLNDHVQDKSSLPVLIHPENGCSTGTAVMAFKQWPFSIHSSIQPIVITSSRPFPIAPHFYGSTIIGDLFFFLFVPFTRYHVRLLPAMTKEAEETGGEFCDRVQKVMADALGVPACRHTRRDVRDHAKRVQQDQASAQAQAAAAARQLRPDGSVAVHAALPDIVPQEEMVQQVQTVFPNAPYHIVARDLARTKSVDLTITNILEGRLDIDVPPPQQPASQAKAEMEASTSKKTKKPAASGAATAALSFQERKQQLIIAARKRYLKRTAGES